MGVIGSKSSALASSLPLQDYLRINTEALKTDLRQRAQHSFTFLVFYHSYTATERRQIGVGEKGELAAIKTAIVVLM